MSGGHYDYGYRHLGDLADNIERDFVNDGKYQTEDWSAECFGRRPLIEADRLSDASESEREQILSEVRSLVDDLRTCEMRAKELEWFLSGDTGPTTYLSRLNEIMKNYINGTK